MESFSIQNTLACVVLEGGVREQNVNVSNFSVIN